MSRESLEVSAGIVADDDLAPFVEGPPDGDPTADRPDAATTGGPPTASRPTPGPPRHRLLVVALVALALVVGALGGATSARQLDRAQSEAEARVVIAVEPTGGGPDDVDSPALPQDDLIMVTVSFSGRVEGATGVVVESLDTPIGAFVLFPPVTLGPDAAPVPTLLRGRIDCAQVTTRQTVESRLLDGSRAAVRPTGLRRVVTVDVLVANPATGLDAAASRCRPEGAAVATAPFEVLSAVARTDGSLLLTLAPRPLDGSGRLLPAPVRSTLLRFDIDYAGQNPTGEPYAPLRPTRASAGSTTFAIPQTRWTITSTPALPLLVTEPTTLRLDVEYACPASSARVTASPLPDLPTEVTLGAVGADGSTTNAVDGFDTALLETAATAAVARGCAKR